MAKSKFWLYLFLVSIVGIYATSESRPALASDSQPTVTTMPSFTNPAGSDFKRVMVRYSDSDSQSKRDGDIATMISRGCILRNKLSSITSFDCPMNQLAARNPDGSVPLQGTDLDVVEAKYYTYLGYLDDKATRVDKVWESGAVGEGMVIAVTDGGVDKTHPDLTDCCVGGSGVPDVGGHGTFITGVITGARIAIPYNPSISYSPALGAAPNSKVAMYNVAWDSGVAPTDTFVSAFEDAASKGIRVVSISLGGAGCTKEGVCDASGFCDSYDPVMTDAIHKGMAKGLIFVIAAGNAGEAGVGSPACVSGVLAVGGSWADGREWSGSSKGKAVDVLAPAVNIYSTKVGGGYVISGGTSFAAPYAAAVVSLLLSADNNLTNDEVHSILKSTASPVKCYQPWITPNQHFELFQCAGAPSGLISSCVGIPSREQCKSSYVAWSSEYPFVQCDWIGDKCQQAGLACVMPEDSPSIPCASSSVGIIDSYAAYAKVKGWSVSTTTTTTTTTVPCNPLLLRGGDTCETTPSTTLPEPKPDSTGLINTLSWITAALSGSVLVGIIKL